MFSTKASQMFIYVLHHTLLLTCGLVLGALSVSNVVP